MKKIYWFLGTVIISLIIIGILFLVTPISDVNAASLSRRLTFNKWQHYAETGGSGNGYAPFFFTYEFYPDGTFRQIYQEDFSLVMEGLWSLEPNSYNSGVIFIVSSREKLEKQYNVFYFEFDDENNLITENITIFKPVQFNAEDKPPIVRLDRAVINPANREIYFPLWFKIVSNKWEKENSNSFRNPKTFIFNKNGTYEAIWARDCRYSGIWGYDKSEKTNVVHVITLKVPANDCDPRGPSEAYVWGMTVEYKDGKLFLSKESYLPT